MKPVDRNYGCDRTNASRRILNLPSGRFLFMDFLLIFSVIIMVLLLLNFIVLIMRIRAAPDKPIGKGIGLVLGLAIGLTLWVPLTYLTGNQTTGIIAGSLIGIVLAIGLELYSRQMGRGQ